MSNSAAMASSSAALSASMAAMAAEDARHEHLTPRNLCVDLMHPEPWSDGSVYILKALFVIALIGMCVGVWKAHFGRYSSRDWEDYAFFGLTGFIVAPLAVAVAVGILAGIVWLFKG